jgi:hypothetical protein
MAVTAEGRPWPHAGRLLGLSRSWRRLDVWEILILALFAGLSIWVLVYDLWQADAMGHIWTGTDGIYPVDQLQYMAWVRDASHHVLVSDMYVLRPTPHDYLEPMVALAGGLTALGMAPWAALLVFQPLAVAALFFAIRAYIHRSLSGCWERRTALVLALFFGSFVVLFAPFAGRGAAGAGVPDEWIPFWTWGYLPGVFAIAALVGALVAYDRATKEGRLVWLAPILGLLASWLHPWQGEELLLIVVIYELGRRTRWGSRLLAPQESVGRASSALPWLTAAATLLPLVYYALLDRLDPIWQMAQAANAVPKSPDIVLLPLVPLLVVAVLGWRGRPRTFMVATSEIWLFAALAVYLLCNIGIGSTPLHAFGGIAVPLSVLTVRGARQLGLSRVPRYRWLAALLVAAVTVPEGVAVLTSVPRYVNSAFIYPNAHRALSYLAENPQPGGVLTNFRLSAVTPSMTGRHTYTGEESWSLPDPKHRNHMVRWLFYEHPRPDRAQEFVRSIGARFILAPCHVKTDLGRVLAPVLAAERHFGCATVYTVKPLGQRA